MDGPGRYLSTLCVSTRFCENIRDLEQGDVISNPNSWKSVTSHERWQTHSSAANVCTDMPITENESSDMYLHAQKLSADSQSRIWSTSRSKVGRAHIFTSRSAGPSVPHRYVQPAVNRQPDYRWGNSQSKVILHLKFWAQITASYENKASWSNLTNFGGSTTFYKMKLRTRHLNQMKAYDHAKLLISQHSKNEKGEGGELDDESHP